MSKSDPPLSVFSKDSPVDESLLIVSEDEGENNDGAQLDPDTLLSIDETLNPFEMLLDNSGISREELASAEGGDRPPSSISESDTGTESTPSPDIPPSNRLHRPILTDDIRKFPGRAISCKLSIDNISSTIGYSPCREVHIGNY